jgi:hypothetical protein
MDGTSWARQTREHAIKERERDCRLAKMQKGMDDFRAV